MSSDVIPGSERRPLRPSFGRIVRRFAYMIFMAVVLWVGLGFLFELVWPSAADFDWRENAITGAIFGASMEAAYLAVELRFGRAAVTDPRHPLRWRAGWLFAGVLGGLLMVFVGVWNAMSK